MDILDIVYNSVIYLMIFHKQAKEMVELSRSIASKIKDKQGDITEDEVRTCSRKLEGSRCSSRSYIMSL